MLCEWTATIIACRKSAGCYPPSAGLFIDDGLHHGLDGLLQHRQIIIDGGLHDRVSRVEVAVGKVVSHTGDLAPWDRGLSTEQFVGQRLDRFADLEQPDSDSVEHQPIRKVAPSQVRANRLDSRLYVREALAITIAHSATSSRSTCFRTRGLRLSAGARSTRAPM